MTTENSRADALTEAQRRTLKSALHLFVAMGHAPGSDHVRTLAGMLAKPSSSQPASAPIDASPNDIPEGCTPADAQMLREANHALAAENDSLRCALRPFARIVSVDKLSWAMVEYCVEGDPEKQTFQAPQMQRAFNRAAAILRDESAQPAPSPADERAAWQTGVPSVKEGSYAGFIVACRRKHDGKVYMFEANYANQYAEELRDDDGEEFTAHGWYDVAQDIHGEYSSVFSKTCGEGDEIIGWQPLPKWGDVARAASANETGAKGADALAHEVWSAAQRAPGEGIEDAVQRIAAILSRSPAMSTQPVRAWETDDGRVISDEQKQGAQAADPVAWRYLTPTGWHATTKLDKALGASAHHDMEPLYAAPQPAQADARVGLTDEQRDVLTWAIGRANAQGEDACADVLRSILASQPGRPEPRSEVTDTARLDWMIAQQAWIQWTVRDGSIRQCQVYDQDEDENYHILSGDDRYFDTPREAIDAARAGEKQ